MTKLTLDNIEKKIDAIPVLVNEAMSRFGDLVDNVVTNNSKSMDNISTTFKSFQDDMKEQRKDNRESRRVLVCMTVIFLLFISVMFNKVSGKDLINAYSHAQGTNQCTTDGERE